MMRRLRNFFGRAMERENAVTSLNTAGPDWEAIADQMYMGICRALPEPSEKDTRRLIELATVYEAAKQGKP